MKAELSCCVKKLMSMLKIKVQKEEDITLKDHQDKQYEAVINFMSYCEQTLRAEPPWLKKLGRPDVRD